MADAAMQRRLMGQKDSRSTQGIISRGANVYKGGTSAARTGGGPNIGRPTGSGTGGGAGAAGGSLNANVGNQAQSGGDMAGIIQRMIQNKLQPQQTPPAVSTTGLPAPQLPQTAPGQPQGVGSGFPGVGDFPGMNSMPAGNAQGLMPIGGQFAPGAPPPQPGQPAPLMGAIQRRLGM